MNQRDIENTFSYHAPSGNQPERYTLLRAKLKELAVLIDQTVPDGREKSIAFTKLEETGFWANAGIARENKVEATNE